MEIVFKIIIFIISMSLSFWLSYIAICIIQTIYDYYKKDYKYRLMHFVIAFFGLLIGLLVLANMLFFSSERLISQNGVSKSALIINSDTWYVEYINGKKYMVTENSDNQLGKWKTYHSLDENDISKETIIIPRDEKARDNIEYRYNEYLDRNSTTINRIQRPQFDYRLDGYKQIER